MLRIADEKALAEAWEKLQANVARAGVTLEGVLVEAMAKPGLEMIVGARRDPDWGPGADGRARRGVDRDPA